MDGELNMKTIIISLLLTTISWGQILSPIFYGFSGGAFAAFSAGIEFRGSSGYVTTLAGDTYCLADAYPVTRSTVTAGQSVTFGWTTMVGGYPVAADRSNSNDARLAGINYTDGGDINKFEFDLPSAGTYTVTVAVGDAISGSSAESLLFYDDTALLNNTTISSVPSTANSFIASNGTLYTAANWVSTGSTVTLSLTFSSTKLVLWLGNAADYNFLAYLKVVRTA